MTIPPDFATAQAAGLAEIAAEATGGVLRTEKLGYGVDLDCFYDLTDNMAEIAAYPEDPAACRRLIAQYVYHLLDTPQGSLVDDKDWGLGICKLTNVGTTTAGLAEIAGRIKSAVQQCDYVDSAQVQIVVAYAPTTIRVTLRITPVDPAIGEFSMVVAATSSGVVLEALEGNP